MCVLPFDVGQRVRAKMAPGLLSDHESEEFDFPAESVGEVVFLERARVHVSFPFPHKPDSFGIAIFEADEVAAGGLVREPQT